MHGGGLLHRHDQMEKKGSIQSLIMILYITSKAQEILSNCSKLTESFRSHSIAASSPKLQRKLKSKINLEQLPS
jgi:hypothetical protein